MTGFQSNSEDEAPSRNLIVGQAGRNATGLSEIISQTILATELEKCSTRNEVSGGREIYRKFPDMHRRSSIGKYLVSGRHVSKRMGEFLSKHRCE